MFDLRGFCLGMLAVTILSALLFGTGSIEVSAEETSVMFYPTTPGAVFEERMSVAVEGHITRLEYQKTTHPSKVHFMESSRIRFAADGPVNVELQLSSDEIDAVYLRTVSKDLEFVQEGRRILFELPGPGHYYLQLPQLAKSRGTYTVLFWIDDLATVKNAESYYSAPKGIIVSEEGVVSDPSKDQTVRIQELLDRGGVIYFPEGIYRTDALCIGSDTTIYLAPGALLKANDDYHKKGNPGAYITIENAQNVLITGVGTIDANGLVAYDVINGETKIHNVNIIRSQGVRLADVLLRDSNSWAIHIMQSQGCNVDNVKIFSGKDGIDLDSSKDVSIKNVFVQSYDDAIAVKTRFAEYPTENIIVRDSIVSSVKSALKIGTETRALVQNVRFESIDVFDGERGIVLYGRDGGPIKDIVWRNIRLFMIDWKDEPGSGAVFDFEISRRDGLTRVENCLIENVNANFLYRSSLAGILGFPLTDIQMRNIMVSVDMPKGGYGGYLFETRNLKNVRIDGLIVNWQGNRNAWKGVASGSIVIEGLKEVK